jgi:hypothetical protein
MPGNYSVRLTVDGKSYTAPLTVKMDPRVTTSPAGLQQQFDLQARLASLLTNSTRALMEARSVREQIKTVDSQASGSVKDSLHTFAAKLDVILGAPGRPGASSPTPTLTAINGTADTLYAAVDSADAAPTTAQATAAAAAEHDASVVLKQWDEMKVSDLPAINAQLRSAHLPELKLEVHSDPGMGEGDEE